MITEDKLYEIANMTLLDDGKFFQGKSVKQPNSKKFKAWRGFQSGSLVTEYGKYEGSNLFTTRLYNSHQMLEEMNFTSETVAESQFLTFKYLIQAIYKNLLNNKYSNDVKN